MSKSLGLYSSVWQTLITISIPVVEGLTLWVESLKCGHIPSFMSIGITVIELHSFKKDEEEKEEKRSIKKKNMDKRGKLRFILTFEKCIY